MAEAIFRDMVRKENLSGKIEVDSGGLGDWHIGNPPHRGTREVLNRQNISYEGMVARKVTEKDWNDFDYIIAMDDQNIEGLKRIRNQSNNEAVIAKLMDYVEDPKEDEVPDPYFTGNFDYTYQLVSEGCFQLLKQIKKEHLHS